MSIEPDLEYHMQGKRIDHNTIADLPHCVCLAGADGTGKTTQAKAILSLLQKQGIPARYVWLRFPWLFCTPFLVYARLRGYSRHEIVGGHRHGYWDFRTSWISW